MLQSRYQNYNIIKEIIICRCYLLSDDACSYYTGKIKVKIKKSDLINHKNIGVGGSVIEYIKN